VFIKNSSIYLGMVSICDDSCNEVLPSIRSMEKVEINEFFSVEIQYGLLIFHEDGERFLAHFQKKQIP